MSDKKDEIAVDEIEIEAFAKSNPGQGAPPAQRYIIRIDKTTYPVAGSSMTGREILTLAGKIPPEGYKLTQKLHGGAAVTIGLDDVVNFQAPGVERFMTLKRDQTEGDMRRQFDLPSFDAEYLGTTRLEWETITEGAGRWLPSDNKNSPPTTTRTPHLTAA